MNTQIIKDYKNTRNAKNAKNATVTLRKAYFIKAGKYIALL